MSERLTGAARSESQAEYATKACAKQYPQAVLPGGNTFYSRGHAGNLEKEQWIKTCAAGMPGQLPALPRHPAAGTGSTALRKVLSSPALCTRCSVTLRPAGRACPRQLQQHRCSTLDLSRGGMTANMH